MNEQRRNEIISRFYGGQSMRSIASSLGLSRHTVSRVVRLSEQARSGQGHPAPGPGAKAGRPSQLQPFEGVIAELLGRYPNLTAVRLLEELRGKGFAGAYTIVRQRLAALRPAKPVRPVVRFETAPGAQAQMDWSVYDLEFTREGRRRVNLFSYILGYSRRQYLHFAASQDQPTLLREHVAAFGYLRGLAAVCLYDNMKTVVQGYDEGEPVYHPTFLGLASHYGFRPWACRVRRAQTKGKVERPFDYVEKNLLNGRSFESLEDLNQVTARWLAEVADVRIHGQTGQRPLDRYQQEQPHLLPLPAQPYDTATVVYRCVDAEGFIAYLSNAYSVPWRHVGRMVAVRVKEKELVVYGPDFCEVARHELYPADVRGQRRVQPGHQGGEDPQHKHQQVRERFEELGAVAAEFFAGLVQSCRYPYQQGQRVLALLATYRRQDLEAALAHAVRYGAYTCRAVERILAAHARPKPPLAGFSPEQCQALAPLVDDQPVRPRPTGQYSDLIPPEPEHGQEHAQEPRA